MNRRKIDRLNTAGVILTGLTFILFLFALALWSRPMLLAALFCLGSLTALAGYTASLERREGLR